MSSNFHTHSIYCDGKNTLEEIVLAALEKNFSAIGFSSHGYTRFDLRYCMKDTEGYIAEIKRLKEKYKKDIEVYLGVEEDAHEIQKYDFDYVIGSSHYSVKDGRYMPIDSSREYFDECFKAWNGDAAALASEYFSFFCDYIKRRKPDIVGHFDLITKYDELDTPYASSNPEYIKISEYYAEKAATLGSLIELNTGAISRGMRKTPYPQINLLRIIKKNGGRLILSSDSHEIKTLDFGFEEAKSLLREVGFREVYTLRKGEFIPEGI